MAKGHDVVSHPFTAPFIRIKAAQLCRRRDFSPSDREDLRQGMYLYLLEKQRLFDPTRGNVEAFVTKLVNTWVGMTLRYRGRAKRLGNVMTVTLERTYIEVDGDKEPLANVIAPADQARRTGQPQASPLERMEIAEATGHAFAQLGPEERRLLVHVGDHGVSATARDWHRLEGGPVSRRHIDERLARMKRRFENAGLDVR